MNLIDLDSALNLSRKDTINLYKKHINKGLLFAFQILGFNSYDITSAKGCHLYLKDGSKILDLTSGIGVLALGHNHDDIVAAEKKCHDLNVIDLQKFGANKLQAALAYNLSQLLPEDLEVSFFAVSGSEANEAALKLVTAAQKTSKKYFISTHKSYHGKTHGSLSLIKSDDFSKGFHIGINKENIIQINYNNISEYKKIIRENGKENIAAIIIEPLQGQDIVVPDRNYLKEICKISKKNNIITIFDEIKCGLGRTGKIFEFLDHDCVPDIVTISKALGGGKNAISVMISKKNIFLKAYGSVKKSSIHTTTFFGLGEACATAIETLNIISDKKFLTNVNQNSNYFFKEINKLKINYPNYIKNVRGKGLFIGIEFNFDKFINLGLIKFKIPFMQNVKSVLMGAIIREYIVTHKILLHFSQSSPEILIILPPLIINKQEINYFIECTNKILKKGLLNLFSNFIIKNINNK